MRRIQEAVLWVVIISVAASYGALVPTTDVFGSGGNQFSIDFVDIGGAGNVADTTGYGAVGYNYRIGQKEVTIDQFSKARAADSRVGDGDEGYWNDGTRTVGLDAPAAYVSVFEAMKFANWLTTGSAVSGVYQFSADGITLLAVDRNAAVSTYGTAYVLPSEDEWYKAAYYKPVDDGSYSLYANGLDSPPTHGTSSGWNFSDPTDGGPVHTPPNHMWATGFGAEEQNGTFDMMGNVWEWSESTADGALDDMNETRVLRGSSAVFDGYFMRADVRMSNGTAYEDHGQGFRVATIPEPSSLVLTGVAGGCGWLMRRRLRR